MDTLRWRVGDATGLRIAELDATAALQGLIPKFDLADVAHAEWLTPDFVDEDGQLRGCHTPHHVWVMIASRGQSAVRAGDVMHHPCQIAYPDWGASSDFNPDQARASRSDVLKRCAESDTLLIGAHFADPVAGRITANGSGSGSGFRLVPIAA